MSPIIIVIGLFVLAAVVSILRLRDYSRPAQTPSLAFDPTNPKELLMRGWNEAEIAKIFEDLKKMHQDRLPRDWTFKSEPLPGEDRRVSFPGNVPDDLIPFLVNYAQYPREIDLKNRSILVIGRVIASTKIDKKCPPELRGQMASFYVPANDQQYDLVYVQVGSRSYQFPFAISIPSKLWKEAPDPRLPRGFDDLLAVAAKH